MGGEDLVLVEEGWVVRSVKKGAKGFNVSVEGFGEGATAGWARWAC